jgi:hypothetical protein
MSVGEIGHSAPQKRQMMGFGQKNSQRPSLPVHTKSQPSGQRVHVLDGPSRSSACAMYSAMLEKQQQQQQQQQESKKAACAPTGPSSSSSEVCTGEATFESPCKYQAEHCPSEATQDKGTTGVSLSFDFLRPDAAPRSDRTRSPKSPETKSNNDTCKDEAARNFRALLETPDVKRGGAGSRGRADCGGHKDKEEDAHFSLLTLRSHQAAIFGVCDSMASANLCCLAERDGCSVMMVYM